MITTELLKLLTEKKIDSYTIMTQELFLQRKSNAFDFNLPLVINGVTDRAATAAKIDAFFACDFEEHGDVIIVRQKPFLDRKVHNYSDLVEIIWRLRDEDGCPWDRAQTCSTIRTNVIEEAYELVEAVDLNDDAKMLEESGDVLLQGLFIAIISQSEGRFSTDNVLTELCNKLITRHTHIFGTNKAHNAEEALGFWEKAKAVEKGQRSVADKIDSVPKTFGALLKANKIQKIIKKTGFDFADVKGAVEKLNEEILELSEASGENVEKEMGDVLFAAVNVARMLHIDPEIALNGSTDKFVRRFSYVEAKAAECGRSVYDCTLDEMENWYQECKKNENR